MKLACEPASSRPKPCASLINVPCILPVHRSLLALAGRKQAVLAGDQLSLQPFPGSSTIELPAPSPNLVSTHPIERATVRLRVRLRATRLRVPPPPEGHQIALWKRGIGWTPSSTNQTAAASLNRPDEPRRGISS